MPTIKNTLNKQREEITKELGYISSIFMSQGEIKAKDIIMPTTELEESVDRLCLINFSTQQELLQEIRDWVEENRYFAEDEIKDDSISADDLIKFLEDK